MAYLTAAEFRVCCTNVDVSAILSDLTDAGAQDAYLDELCDDASGDLDGYAEAGGYPAPLVITTQVKRIAFELAWFMLCRRKNWNYGEVEAKNEAAVRRKLERLADRKFRLTKQGKKSADQATNIRPSNPAARVTGQRRKLTRHTMEGF